jgi:hypothetical protein
MMAVTALLVAASASVHADPLFQPTVQIPGGIRTRSVAIGDVNGDGRPDLVVGNTGPSIYAPPAYPRDSCYLSVMLGNGDGTFGPRTGFSLGDWQVPTKIVMADVNNDGHADLVCEFTNTNFGAAWNEIMMGNGDGTFTRIPQALGGFAIAVGDLNGDGRLDIATVQEASQVSVRLGNGDGTFAAATPYATGYGAFDVAIADFNVDGRLDIATVNHYDGSISMLLGYGNGTFAPHIDTVTESAPRVLAVGYLDTDLLPDIAVAHFNTVNISVHLNLGGGALGPWTGYAGGGNPMALAIADLNFDARGDLVEGCGSTAVLLANADGTWGPRTDYTGGYSVAIGDLNSDGEPDIASVYFSSDVVSILFNVPDQIAAVPLPIGGSGLNLVAPNPARSAARIEYTVARAGPVRLEVADVTGRVVATLFRGDQAAGRYPVSWDGTASNEKLPAGIYFVRLTTLGQSFASKLIRIQ